MNKKLLLITLISLLLVSSVSAMSSLDPVKQGETISLFQYCDSCTYVNVESVVYPDQTISFLNASMTKNGLSYNYSFSDTSMLGGYLYVVCGDKAGVLTCEDIVFDVTPDGFLVSMSDFGLVFLFLVIIIFCVCIGYFGSSITFGSGEVKNFIGVKIAGFSLAALQFLMLLGVLSLKSRGLYVDTLLTLNFRVMLVLIILGLIVYLFMYVLRMMNPGDTLDEGDGGKRW